MTRQRRRVGFGFLLWLAGHLALAHAQAQQPPDTDWVRVDAHPEAAVQLALTGQRTEEGAYLAFLAIQLDDPWKTYWRSPGEAGLAPVADWSGSRNLGSVEWFWPRPHRYELQGIETLGYKGEVAFPLHIYPEDPGQPVQLTGRFTLPSCTTLCVLTDYDLALTLPSGEMRPIEERMRRFNQSMSEVPVARPDVRVTTFEWDANSGLLQVVAEREGGWTKADVIIDGAASLLDEVQFHRPAITVDGNTVTVVFEPEFWSKAPDWVGETLTVTLLGETFAAEASVALTPGTVSPPASSSVSLATVLLFAFLGGLILNVMPCVLPVLGLKLHGLIGAGGQSRQRIRRQFLASAGGILVSFWLLAAFMQGLKWSGSTLGWGIQFQSPAFVALMALITFLFALNLLGLFELRLPGRWNQWVAGRGDDSLGGHFIQGAFATLLATPCTAPFLGTAIAFALGANAWQLWLTFTGLAVGMAAPWLLVAAVPSLAARLPSPGPWMTAMKWVFGALMAATSVWLLSLWAGFLSPLQTGLLVALLSAVTLFLVTRRFGVRGLWVTLAAGVPSVLAVLLVVALIRGPLSTSLPSDLRWQTLDTQAISAAVQEGEVVFVDVTADWCVTCQANKVGVLLQEPVYSALQADDVVRQRGDWTRPDERITDYLQSQGQYGVPFNSVYGPGAPDGIPLPVILRDEAVLDALERARGEHSSREPLSRESGSRL